LWETARLRDRAPDFLKEVSGLPHEAKAPHVAAIQPTVRRARDAGCPRGRCRRLPAS